MSLSSTLEIRYLGLSRTVEIDLGNSFSEFKKSFEKEVAEKSFFTSFKGGNEKYHGTMEHDGKTFEMKERKGFFGGKKVIPNVKGALREVNGTTRLKVEVITDWITLLPYVIAISAFLTVINLQHDTFPSFFIFIIPIYFILNYFFLRHAVKKTMEQVQMELKYW